MTGTCLFCNEPEKGHPDHVNYVCSSCVQALLYTDKDQMKRLKAKAESKGNGLQLRAIKLFYR